MKPKYANGLAAVMAGRKLGYSAVGRMVGLPRQYIKRYADGDVRIMPDLAEKLAAALSVPPEVLLFPGRSETATAVPLLSWISAGGFAAPRDMAEHDEPLEMLRWSLSEKGDWFALRVEGDSMNRISPPDSIIFVNRREKKLVGNACYIIASPDTGEAAYKRYRPDPPRWEPVSTNDEHEPSYVEHDGEPVIIGRVRRTLLSM